MVSNFAHHRALHILGEYYVVECYVLCYIVIYIRLCKKKFQFSKVFLGNF